MSAPHQPRVLQRRTWVGCSQLLLPQRVLLIALHLLLPLAWALVGVQGALAAPPAVDVDVDAAVTGQVSLLVDVTAAHPSPFVSRAIPPNFQGLSIEWSANRTSHTQPLHHRPSLTTSPPSHPLH